MVSHREGSKPNFDEAFTQLHLGQFLALVKCLSRDRRDGGIDPNTDNILRNIVSARPRVDEDLGISRVATYLLRLPTTLTSTSINLFGGNNPKKHQQPYPHTAFNDNFSYRDCILNHHHSIICHIIPRIICCSSSWP